MEKPGQGNTAGSAGSSAAAEVVDLEADCYKWEEGLFAQVEEVKRAISEKGKENDLLQEENSQLKGVILNQSREIKDLQQSLANDRTKDTNLIIELKNQVCELKCANLRAEIQVEAYKRRFEELDMRVLLIEKDIDSLKNAEASDRKEKGGKKRVCVVKTEKVGLDGCGVGATLRPAADDNRGCSLQQKGNGENGGLGTAGAAVAGRVSVDGREESGSQGGRTGQPWKGELNRDGNACSGADKAVAGAGEKLASEKVQTGTNSGGSDQNFVKVEAPEGSNPVNGSRAVNGAGRGTPPSNDVDVVMIVVSDDELPQASAGTLEGNAGSSVSMGGNLNGDGKVNSHENSVPGKPPKRAKLKHDPSSSSSSADSQVDLHLPFDSSVLRRAVPGRQ